MSPTKITEKNFPEKTFNNCHRRKRRRKKRRHNFFTAFTVDFVSRSICENFLFYHRVAKKSDRILQKKLFKKSFLEEIL